jgi:hypothetical protein
MVCRASRLSSAVVTFARDMSGLEDNQILGLNHALMQEGAQSPTPTPEQWDAVITDMQERYRAGLVTINPGSHDPIARLDAARTETPDAQRYYAVQRLIGRSAAAAHAQTDYFARYARTLGVALDHARGEYWAAFSEASDNARLCASPQFVTAWNRNPDHANLAVDRRSLYAYEQMEVARAASLARRESRPTVTATWRFEENPSRPGRGYISAIAHDPDTGHTEITWARDGQNGLTHAYQGLGRDEIQALTASSNATHREDYFRAFISGQPEYRYETRAEAEAARVRYRCASCGQFSATEHSCPVLGSEEALNRDTRQAVAVALTAAGAPGSEITPTIPVVSATGTRRYDVTDGLLRIPGITRITSEARANGLVAVPVHATMNDAVVSGQIAVEYNGRGNGYTITAVNEPGDSGQNRLSCTCPAYRANYRCEHLTATLNRISALARGEGAATRAQAAVAITAVTAELEQEYAASVNATTASAAAFPTSSVRLADDTAQFQRIYEQARRERQEYQQAITSGATDAAFPISYSRENAFGGLATRESGRGFGVEIEFAFPQDMSPGDRRQALRAIGRELYESGLTREQNQQGYGASHNWYRDTHTRGWSFEADPSTGGSDGQSGGEIVSPVMFDEPDTWTNLEKITAVLNRHGAIASRGSGMHVHVSTGDYDHRVENHNRLLQTFAENEDLLYRLSSNPERGRHRGTGYCSPNHYPAAPYANVGSVQSGNNSHGIALNMQSVRGRSNDHVEFRTFDATLNPAVMQAQAAIAVYMTHAATRPDGPTTPNENRNPIGSRLEANPSRDALSGDAWHETTLGFRKFLDRVVPGGPAPEENPRIRQLVSLFAMTKWQKTRRSW